MPRPRFRSFFQSSLKSESHIADEVINTYVMRRVAAVVTWILYPTSVTPNDITLASTAVGLFAACIYYLNTPAAIACAGLLVTLKDILDDADGQLARAKQLYSRRGRFLDSLGDFVVDVALFIAITAITYRSHPNVSTIFLGLAGFVGITLRVSYHVFYQVSYLHLESTYLLNRITEDVTEADRRADRIAFVLQVVFNVMYGWQDRLFFLIDAWCRGRQFTDSENARWYSDRVGLRISGLLGFGTELALLTLCSLMNALSLYLILNVILMNGILLTGILYRRFFLRRSLLSDR
ncbi:MAG TPA: CDP-alcohol phosphatidyltransferase family protein [Bacteroidota bacterium]|nr:CDP-alcohol phosphatidyltransferase family protein [Bacteroidota bacterium]